MNNNVKNNTSNNNYIIPSENFNVLESILNGMDAYLYVSDTDTDEILFINDKMREHFGYHGEVGNGKKCWEVLQSGMEERCPFCPNYYLQDHPNETKIWEEHNTATKRYYRNSDKYINWPDGRLVHMQHSVDITEMKESQDSLEQRRAQHELMAQVSQCFIFGDDIDAMIKNAINLVGEFSDYKRVMLTLNNILDKELIVTHQWPLINEDEIIIKNTIPFTKGEYLFDLFHSKRDSAISNEVVSIKNIYNADEIGIKSVLSTPVYLNDDVLGVLIFESDEENYQWESHDIHLAEFLSNIIAGVYDRKRTADSLAKMNTLIQQAMQPIVYIDTNEEVRYYNAYTYKVFGYTEEELLEGGLEMLFGKETYERVRTEVWPKAFAEGIIEIDLPLFHKDGRKMIFSFLGVVIHIKEEPSQLATIGTDITDLVSAKDAAEAASKSKTEFLARMSHEIRTPMNAIIGMTNIAQESDDPERKKYCLEKISSASNHLLGVINDILDMSKIEANKFEISNAEFNFEKMLINISYMVSFRMDEKNHNFLVKFEPDIPRSLIGDEQRLAQVIVNLLSNAVKFTPENGTITLYAKRIETKGNENTLRFSVTDTGIGISPEQQSKLFTSFEQADGSISRRFGGTGLGLAISKRIIELMGGDIWIESEEGQGTKVIFDVIMSNGDNNEHPNLANKIDRKDLRILIVDDSPDTLEYFHHLLKQNKINYDVAESGAEALNLLDESFQNNSPFNFFFVDWMMPEMNGLELTKIIKKRLPGNSVIVMISAAHWSEIEADAIAAGVNGFVPKPLFPSAVFDSINSHLSPIKKEDLEIIGEKEKLDFSNYTILLVEDVEVNREIVMASLEETKISIEIAENGVEAVEKFNNDGDKYDLIFMDIHMPIMDGYEATRKIRLSDKKTAKQIPIIAMTANVFKEDIDRCMEAGMNDHVGKPIDLKIVLDKLNTWLNPQ